MGTNHGGVNFGRRSPPIGGQFSTLNNNPGAAARGGARRHRHRAPPRRRRPLRPGRRPLACLALDGAAGAPARRPRPAPAGRHRALPLPLGLCRPALGRGPAAVPGAGGGGARHRARAGRADRLSAGLREIGRNGRALARRSRQRRHARPAQRQPFASPVDRIRQFPAQRTARDRRFPKKPAAPRDCSNRDRSNTPGPISGVRMDRLPNTAEPRREAPPERAAVAGGALRHDVAPERFVHAASRPRYPGRRGPLPSCPVGSRRGG